MNNSEVTIIGAGLAGCEAALQIAKSGQKVALFDQKPEQHYGAYCMDTLAELVCNNSLGSKCNREPLGLLISELKILGSELIKLAEQNAVCDGRYLAVNKKAFSESVTEAVTLNENITLFSKYCEKLPESDVIIVASGPMTNAELLNEIATRYDMQNYHFADSSCAIIDINSINLSDPRITRVSDDLYAVFIPTDIFSLFCHTLVQSSQKSKKRHDNSFFIECNSIEELALKGAKELQTKRFSHPGFSERCLLLRREGVLENGFIMVGCMTKMSYNDQRFAFSLLPGFENLKIIKYGRMHQNTFFDSPGHLDSFYKVKNHDLYIIGQLSGIDGYAPAISSGFVAAQRVLYGNKLAEFPKESMIGGLAHYVSNEQVHDFQPMCAKLELLPNLDGCIKYETALDSIYKYSEALQRLKKGASDKSYNCIYSQ